MHLADGSVTATLGDTTVMCTVVPDSRPASARYMGGGRSRGDFVPLTVDYKAKGFAAGKIPGTLLRREMAVSDAEVLTSRLIDRCVRPLFPSGFVRETQITATLLSYSDEGDTEVAAINGASAALCCSSIPFKGPVAAVRVALVDGELVVNPAASTLKAESCTLNLLVAASDDGIVVLDAEGNQIPEGLFCDAIEFAEQHARELLAVQHELIKSCAAESTANEREVGHSEKIDEVATIVHDRLLLDPALVRFGVSQLRAELAEVDGVLATPLDAEGAGGKRERIKSLVAMQGRVFDSLRDRLSASGDFSSLPHGSIDIAAAEAVRIAMREQLLIGEGATRCDGRGEMEVRPISAECSVLPVVHGSAHFKRGETSALAVITLGKRRDAMLIHSTVGSEAPTTKSFFAHYAFPLHSKNSQGNAFRAKRREVGHSALVEKALRPVVPAFEDFPYTVRVAAEVTSSDGSSSMASTCAASLALMDAGVPITDIVAGVAIGLITTPPPPTPMVSQRSGMHSFQVKMLLPRAERRAKWKLCAMKCSSLTFSAWRMGGEIWTSKCAERRLASRQCTWTLKRRECARRCCAKRPSWRARRVSGSLTRSWQ